jgi:hypothetical protein
MFAKEVALFLNSQQYSDYQFKVRRRPSPFSCVLDEPTLCHKPGLRAFKSRI